MKIHFVSNNRRALASFLMALLVLPACVLFAQGTPPLAKPGRYTGRNITGELVRNQRVNIKELASAPTAQASSAGAEIQRHREDALHPPVRESGAVISRVPAEPLAAAAAPTPSFRGFTGLTHLQQRTARNGNQFSTEPPDQGLAVGNGFVLEAINSALNVYDTNGIQLLPNPVALSEFFGLPPGINRTTGFNGVFPGDPVACLIQKRNGGLSSPGRSSTPPPVYQFNRAGYISPSAKLLIQPVTISFTSSIPRWRMIPTKAGRVSPTSRTSRSTTMASTSASMNSTLPLKATLTDLLMPPLSPFRKTI